MTISLLEASQTSSYRNSLGYSPPSDSKRRNFSLAPSSEAICLPAPLITDSQRAFFIVKVRKIKILFTFTNYDLQLPPLPPLSDPHDLQPQLQPQQPQRPLILPRYFKLHKPAKPMTA